MLNTSDLALIKTENQVKTLIEIAHAMSNKLLQNAAYAFLVKNPDISIIYVSSTGVEAYVFDGTKVVGEPLHSALMCFQNEFWTPHFTHFGAPKAFKYCRELEANCYSMEYL